MILVLHNRYRTAGGEERAVEDLLWLLREHLGEEAEVMAHDSALLGRPRAAVALLRGGLDADDVAAAVRRAGARVVHAHNLNPGFGWRGLAAARRAGARVVLHLHNYRLVCAVATCFTRDAECTRCHGRNTLPGLMLNCRGTRAESAVYAAALALWQRRVTAAAHAVVVPSRFARERLRALAAPLGPRVAVVPHLVRSVAESSSAATGSYALVCSRLAPEKGVEVAIDACRRAGVALVVAGDGPAEEALRALGARGGGEVRFAGRVEADGLAELRAGAGLALVPSRSAETFGLAAAEAMAAGVPVLASAIGALPELVDEDDLVAPGDPVALAAAIPKRFGDAEAGERGLARVHARAGPAVAAAAVRAVHELAAAAPSADRP